jgi:hypothetical protein
VIAAATAVPDVFPLLEKINISPGICKAPTDLANPFTLLLSRSPPDTVFLDLISPKLYLHCPTSGVYQFSSTVL